MFTICLSSQQSIFKKTLIPVFFSPIMVYWKAEGTPLPALLARPYDAPKASNYKEATKTLVWVTAQSIILTEQMGKSNI